MKNWKLLLVPAIVLVVISCSKTGEDAQIIDPQDITLVHIAAVSNAAEIMLGQLAADSSKTPSIQAFGQQMVTEHSQADAELRALAAQLNIPVPDTIDQKHLALAASLKTIKDSARFDSTYIHSQVEDHVNAVILFQTSHGLGNNQSLRSYIEATVPKLQMHLNAAQALAQQYP